MGAPKKLPEAPPSSLDELYTYRRPDLILRKGERLAPLEPQNPSPYKGFQLAVKVLRYFDEHEPSYGLTQRAK